MRGAKVRFAEHAMDKFGALKRYGFEVSNEQVVEAVSTLSDWIEKAASLQ